MRTHRLMTAALAVLAAALGSASGSDGEPRIHVSGSSIEVTGLEPEGLEALRAAEMSRQEWTRVLRVTVDGPDSLPAVLGRYQVVGERLRFTPMFPFDPGRKYRVRFDLGPVLPGAGEPVESVVSLPAPDVEPTTKVETIYPTADRLPENQLKFYIHFSAPMRRGDGLRFIRLLDASGEEVADPFLPLGEEFWDAEHRRYTVFFDPGRVKRGILPNEELGRPIREGEEYTLVIEDSWQDAEGNPLREPYRKRFRVGPSDRTPPDPARFRLEVPPAGRRDPLVVVFSEPMDHGLLNRALGVETEDGHPVEGEAVVSAEETRWAFTPEEPWQAGGYHLIALSILEDLAGNQIGKLFEVDLFDRIEAEEQREVYRVPFAITAR